MSKYCQLKIEYVNPKELKPARFNPRKWTEEQQAALKNSISEFGNVEPFVVNQRSGRLVGGHFRRKIAIELGIEQVPIVYVDLDDKKEKALNVALNSPYLAGDWDFDKLDCLLDEIQTDDEQLFEGLNFDALLQDVANAEQDIPYNEEPPLTQEPTSDDDWVKFQIGEIKGKIFIDVYTLFLSEWERLKSITNSDKITPNLEVMIANSAGTPNESLK